MFRVFGDDAIVSDEDSLESPSPGENLADGNPTRVFPDMAQVLAGNTNARHGHLPDATTPANRALPDRCSTATRSSCPRLTTWAASASTTA